MGGCAWCCPRATGPAEVRDALVFGGTGQIGRPVVERLRAAGWRVTAVSRRDQPDADGLRWAVGDFDAMPTLSAAFDAIISCGPLDRFGRWYAQANVTTQRVIAFGSTSIDTKQVTTEVVNHDAPVEILAEVLKIEEDIIRRGKTLLAMLTGKQ